ncbi:MAG: hypothetical protein ACXWF4_03750 [Candidatus Aminicenantales bacterium]
MKKPFLMAVAAVALEGLLTSCILVSDPEGEPGWRTTPESSSKPRVSGSEFRQTFPFTPGGTLSLENDYGDVEITGWDRDEVEVVAKAATGAAQLQRSARQSRGRGGSPEVEVRETNEGLLIRTPTFEGPGQAPAANYEVQAPNSVVLTGIRISEGNLTVADVFGRIDASVDLGDLTVRNYSGPLRATVGTGNADVEVLDLRDGDEISITSRRGDIFLRLESGVGAIIEADAPNGQVSSDFDLGMKLPASTVKGWIGQGGPTIILRASAGRIRIIKTVAAGATPAAAKAGKRG